MAGAPVTAASRQGLLALVSTVAVAGSLATAEQIVARHEWRLDLTPDQRYVLSAHARRALADVPRDALVTAFVRPDDPRNRELEDLLRQISTASARVRWRTIDVNRNPAVARQYGAGTYGAVVVESDGRQKTLVSTDERTLVGAIRQVTRPERPRVYVLTGHGERAIRDSDRQYGYSSAKAALLQEQYDVRELASLAEHGVPDDASVLVIAGPRSDLLAGELVHLDAYLRRGGGLLVLLDPGTETPSLMGLLRQHGIEVGDGIVVDADNRLFAGDYLTMVIANRAADHPVSAGLQALPLMSQVRPVGREDGTGTSVLSTAAQSWRTLDLGVLRTGVTEFDEQHDTRGPVTVGVAVGGDDRSAGRILVYGDSDFATNFFLDYLGNCDLWLNSINWLAREEALIGSREPVKTPGVNQFFLSARQGRLIFWLGTVVQPALVLLLGMVVMWVRRKEA